jgi:hypothetical protein
MVVLLPLVTGSTAGDLSMTGVSAWLYDEVNNFRKYFDTKSRW